MAPQIGITEGLSEMSKARHLTGVERTFEENEIIVSKTDLKGRIEYANDVFLRVAGYHENELLGQPHSIIRHPEMPRCVFKLLWDTIGVGGEIFAYVNNCAKNGDNYWVFAHVTASYAKDGTINGYHSSRRVPNPLALEKVKPLYARLLEEEQRFQNRKDGMNSATELFGHIVSKQGLDYERLVSPCRHSDRGDGYDK